MLKTRGEIKEWLHNMKIKKYILREDLTVDVHESVDISQEGLTEIPVQFGKVEGDFDCGFNDLTSLKGCPIFVHGYFSCDNNKLMLLEFCPKKVFKDFRANHNSITSLEHAPEFVGGKFDVSFNPIADLKGLKTKVRDMFIHRARNREEFIEQCQHLYNDKVIETYQLILEPEQLQSLVLKEELSIVLSTNKTSSHKKTKL